MAQRRATMAAWALLGPMLWGTVVSGAAAAAETLTFGIVSANPNYWAIYVARDKGLY